MTHPRLLFQLCVTFIVHVSSVEKTYANTEDVPVVCVKGSSLGHQGATCVHGDCEEYNSTLFQNTFYEDVQMLPEDVTGEVCVCNPGYFGISCTEQCPDYFWGYYCSEHCNIGCKDNYCNRMTGECMYGCERIYEGEKCITKKLCQALETCINGACDSYQHCVCDSGYYGPSCDKTCSQKRKQASKETQDTDCYFYGRDCAQECSCNCLVQPCDSREGFCEERLGLRCIEPWTGLYCNESLTDITEVNGIFSLSYDQTSLANQQAMTDNSSDAQSSSDTSETWSVVNTLDRIHTETKKNLQEVLQRVLSAGKTSSSYDKIITLNVVYRYDYSTILRVKRQLGPVEGQLDMEFHASVHVSEDVQKKGKLASQVTAAVVSSSEDFSSDLLPGLTLIKDSVDVREDKVQEAKAPVKNDDDDTTSWRQPLLGTLIGGSTLLIILVVILLIKKRNDKSVDINHFVARNSRYSKAYFKKRASRSPSRKSSGYSSAASSWGEFLKHGYKRSLTTPFPEEAKTSDHHSRNSQVDDNLDCTVSPNEIQGAFHENMTTCTNDRNFKDSNTKFMA